MPPFHCAYTTARGGFLLKKLFPNDEVFQIQHLQLFKYSGEYSIHTITDSEFSCMLPSVSVHINGTNIAVKNLLEDGFVVTCKELQQLSIKRL